MTRLSLQASLTALALLLAGCGSSSTAPRSGESRPAGTKPASTASASQGGTAQVEMKNIKFVPRRVTVRLGQAVRWTNRDGVPHTVASTRLRLSSDAIPAGATFSYRPRRRGRFPYFCTIHANQNGVLIVH